MSMNVIKIVSVAICALIAILLLRKVNSEYAVLILLFTNISFTVFSVAVLIPVFEYIKGLSENQGFGYLVSIIFKSCGICLLCSVAASLCKDAGEITLGNHIELCGKCTLIAMSLPLIKTVFDYAKAFLA